MKNILWIVCLPLGLMLAAPIDAQQQASQKPVPNTGASQNQTELGKLIGIVEQMDKRLERMENRFDHIENRLDRIENRQAALEKKVDAKFEQIDTRFEQVDARFEQMDARFERMDARLERMDARFEQLHNRMNTMFYWFMGIISTLVAPIAITLGYDTYRRLRNPSPLYPSERREESGERAAHSSSPQTIGDQEAAKQATGS